jgi:hypothetical protein
MSFSYSSVGEKQLVVFCRIAQKVTDVAFLGGGLTKNYEEIRTNLFFN